MHFVQFLFQVGDRDLAVVEDAGGEGCIGTPFGQHIGYMLYGSGTSRGDDRD